MSAGGFMRTENSSRRVARLIWCINNELPGNTVLPDRCAAKPYGYMFFALPAIA
jgi:hypothetical protein